VTSDWTAQAQRPCSTLAGRELHPCTGLTLIEVLITISILASALLALARLQNNLLHANVLARQRSTAIHFAQDRIERLRLQNAAGMAPVGSSDTLGPPLSGSDIELEGLTTMFKRHWSLSSSPFATTQGLTVKISWRGPARQPHSIRLDSLLSSP